MPESYADGSLGGGKPMKRQTVMSFAVVCFIASAGYVTHSAPQVAQPPSPSQQAAASPASATTPEPSAVLQKYCVTCHNDKVKAGQLVFSALDVTNLSKDAEKWEKVVRKVRT